MGGWGEFTTYAANLIRRDKRVKPARIDFINSYKFTHDFSRSGKDFYELVKGRYSDKVNILDTYVLVAHPELIFVTRALVPAKEKYVAKVERDAIELLSENDTFSLEKIKEIADELEIDEERVCYLTSKLEPLYRTKTNK
ncbi:MAG: hypothetical protein ACE5J7_04860 [Candidatus Aenigmatarchaeota archaeon]